MDRAADVVQQEFARAGRRGNCLNYRKAGTSLPLFCAASLRRGRMGVRLRVVEQHAKIFA